MAILKGVPLILSPQLLSVLAQMGHGDRLVLADANFPAVSVAKHTTAGLVDATGLAIPQLLEAILTLLPLDTYEKHSAYVMQRVPKDADLPVPVWDEFQRICNAAEKRDVSIGQFERFEFYEQAKQAFAVVVTSERALYGNIILVKGVIG